MLLIQMTGLSGAGKSTIAQMTQIQLRKLGYAVEIIDGDAYRQHLCQDLGFSQQDRLENIRRLGNYGLALMQQGVIVILAVINPYDSARQKLQAQSPQVKTVFIDCPLTVVAQRDPKGLYRRAQLPPTDPQYLPQFTGISDPFEPPAQPDLRLPTHELSIETATDILIQFILNSSYTSRWVLL
jgi:adenylylsulfate kinase